MGRPLYLLDGGGPGLPSTVLPGGHRSGSRGAGLVQHRRGRRLLPTYSTVGIWAAVALFVLRICQGLAVGGQWGGAVLLATEYAPPSRRGFYGSFAQVGVPVGLVLGNAFFLVLAAVQTQEAFAAWGWRIPFIASIVLIGLAMYIQLRLEDTPAFRRLQERQQQAQEEGDETQQRSPVLQVIREHPKQILLAAG